MNRYIDADKIDIRAREGYNHDGILYLPYRDIRKSLDSAPSIDIVFCRECKYTDGEPPIADGRYWCVLHGSFMYYCSDGKRSNE